MLRRLFAYRDKLGAKKQKNIGQHTGVVCLHLTQLYAASFSGCVKLAIGAVNQWGYGGLEDGLPSKTRSQGRIMPDFASFAFEL